MTAPLKISAINLLTTTACNAWDLPSVPGSPGVCRFCYREREKVVTDAARLERVIARAIELFDVDRFTLTGGEPLMSVWTLPAAVAAKRAGREVHVHTNGLLFDDGYPALGEHVDVWVLALDGAVAEYADWERGVGYFARVQSNLARLVADRRTIAINSFVSPHNRAHVGELARMLDDLATRVELDYWLVSQYRNINRANATKDRLYLYPKEEFVAELRAAVAPLPRFLLFWTPAEYVAAQSRIESMPGRVVVFGQPSREPGDPYPFRLWLSADGFVTVDAGVNQGRNAIAGNLVDHDADALLARIRALGSEAKDIVSRSLFRRPERSR